MRVSEIRGSRNGPAFRGACHRAALRAGPLAHAGYNRIPAGACYRLSRVLLCMSRMRCSAKRCTAVPGPRLLSDEPGSRVCSAALRTALRPGHVVRRCASISRPRRWGNGPWPSRMSVSEIRGSRNGPAFRGACHRAALRAGPLAHAGYNCARDRSRQNARNARVIQPQRISL
jgi:hypothetical protein